MLYIIPSWINHFSSILSFSNQHKEIVKNLKFYIVENENKSKKFLKFIFSDINFNIIKFTIFNKKSNIIDIYDILNLLKNGIKVGLLSDFGLPCIADPGNLIVKYCHNNSIRVMPLSGSSSIFMALMSSGLNGQNFSFHGYLPINKKELKKKIYQLEFFSKKFQSSQIFIEAPFKNNQLLKQLFLYLSNSTMLCIAVNVSSISECIKTKSIQEWKKIDVNLHKKPTIFIIESN